MLLRTQSLDMKPFHTWFHTHPLELLWKPGYRSCMPDCVTCMICCSHVKRKNCFASWWPAVLNTKCNAYHEKDVMWQATTRSISLLIVCWLLCNADKLSIPCVSHSVTRHTGELLGGRAQEAFRESTYSDLSLPLILLLTSSYPCMVRICNIITDCICDDDAWVSHWGWKALKCKTLGSHCVWHQ